MRVVAVEEHFATPEVIAAWSRLGPYARDAGFHDSVKGPGAAGLLDLGTDRIAAMDERGIDVAVLSLTTPGVQDLSATEAVRLQTQANDLIAETVSGKPDRFQGLATLATPDPAAAVRELERAVTTLGLNGAMVFGRTGARNMDDPAFWPIYEAAAALRAPLYLHPQSGVPAVRQALYGGFDADVSTLFSISGIGWHYEAGVQAIRLILAGVLDRFPDLQLILGHWGEVILFYLERIDLLAKVARLPRSFQQYARDQFYVSPSGSFSQRYLRWATEVVGIERILFSTDHPFGGRDAAEVQRFLAEAPISDAEREQMAGGNWDRLIEGIRR